MDPLVIDKSSPVRKFDSAAINAQLDKAISILDKDSKGALITVVDMNAVHVAVVGKKDWGNNGSLVWSVTGTYPYGAPKPDLEAQIKVQW